MDKVAGRKLQGIRAEINKKGPVNTPGRANENFQLRRTSSDNETRRCAGDERKNVAGLLYLLSSTSSLSGAIHFLFHYYYIIGYRLVSSLFILPLL